MSVPAFLADRVVESDAGCWEWTMYRNLCGYGHTVASPTSGTVLAHRVVWEIVVGPIPDGLVLDHLCRVRHCVNPRHLEPVTQAENVRRSRRDTCRRGHPYDAENTYYRPGTTKRACRACQLLWEEQHRAERILRRRALRVAEKAS